MLLGIRWEKNALAETVPKDRQILATGDSNSSGVRYFDILEVWHEWAGAFTPRSEIHRRSSFIPINQNGEP